MEQTAKHVIFKGRVQGVGFRYTTLRVAQRHELTGFVRNLPDSSVEALLQGTQANIRACIDDLHEDFGGYIREVKVTDQPLNPQFHDFRITY